MNYFGNREAERVCIVPTELNLDLADGYPKNNGNSIIRRLKVPNSTLILLSSHNG